MHQITYFSIYIDYENRHLTSFHFANISSIKSGYNLLKKFQRWNTKGKDDINCLHTRFHNEKVYKSSPLLNRAIIKFKTFWQRHVNLSFSFFIVVTMNNNFSLELSTISLIYHIFEKVDVDHFFWVNILKIKD